MAKITITQNAGTPIEREILAAAIVRLSKAVKTLSDRSGLNREAVVVLLHNSTKISKKAINTILASIADLERDYVTLEKQASASGN